MYGSFWELRFRGHKRHPARVIRNGGTLQDAPVPYRVFGPTCDSSDMLPEPIELPGDIDVGDYIEFGSIGAYSISGRTSFNGFDAGPTVMLTSAHATPP
jgi:ornithine decarboxylase